MASEPANLIEWVSTSAPGHGGRLFTCGRPGRATYRWQRVRVDDETIDLWVNGLPEADVLHVVSLLGKKRDGFSEFGYYPFRSSAEGGTQPTFQEWLDHCYGPRFVIHELPTVDARGIPTDQLQEASCLVLGLIRSGNTVVIVDSAGAERTARVCEAMGYERQT